jgi:signal peptide peptidase SppA
MSDRKPERVLRAITEEPWAITEPWLETIHEIASRENLSPEAVAAREGSELANTRTVTARSGVAIVPFHGPIFRRANLMTRYSGATAISHLATDFTAALEDGDIRGILLDVDSPGGQVNGTQELADMIHAARDRKPIAAFVGGTGASGAYWLASAAETVITSDTALLGSIGVVLGVVDTRGAGEKAGIRTIEIVSSQSPRKRVDVDTEDGKGQLQAIVDALAEVFLGRVARNRGVPIDTVRAEFGRGGIFVGQGAVDARLADRVGTFESTLAELADRGRSRRTALSVAASLNSEEEAMAEDTKTAAAPTIDRAYLDANHADLVAQIRAEAATAERDRILGIEEVALPGHEKLVADMKKDPNCSVDQAARRILAAEKAAGNKQLRVLQADEDALAEEKPAAVMVDATTGENEAAASQQRMKAAAEAARKRRIGNSRS